MGEITWQGAYEAFGTRTAEDGETTERQMANTKEEDPTGLLNEGFRYRDLEAGVWLTRDPAGFVDGPNVYTYVKQNPWTYFDPYGLWGFGESNGALIDGLWNGVAGYFDNRNAAMDERGADLGGALRNEAGGVVHQTGAILNNAVHLGAMAEDIGDLGDRATAGILNKISGEQKYVVPTGQGTQQQMRDQTGKLVADKIDQRIPGLDKDSASFKHGQTNTNVAAVGVALLTPGPDELALTGASARTIVTKAPGKVDNIMRQVDEIVESGGQVKINRAGDPIIMKGDKKVRIDHNNSHGDKPHFHHEEQAPSGKWKDAGDEHRYYFKEE